MAEWVEACDAGDVDEEDVIRFDHDGRTFAIYRSPDDEYFATEGFCTHEKVHLADGLVMDDIIECPKHNGRFNYKTGAGQGRAGLRQPADLSGESRGRKVLIRWISGLMLIARQAQPHANTRMPGTD